MFKGGLVSTVDIPEVPAVQSVFDYFANVVKLTLEFGLATETQMAPTGISRNL